MSSASRLFLHRTCPSRNSGDSLQRERDREWEQLSLHNRRLHSWRKSRGRRLRDPGPSRVVHTRRFASPQELRIFSSDDAGTSGSSANGRIQREITDIRITGLTSYGNDRLPSAVLQARARLLERLRGVFLTGSRQRRTLDVTWDEFPPTPSEDITVTNSGGLDSDSQLDWVELGSPQRESPFSFQNAGRKPPGLGLDAVGRLQREVFKDATVNGIVPSGDIECSICLEMFSDGDRLIRLSCGHRFHTACLIPWIKTCGSCPYCRRTVIMGDDQQQQLKATQIR